MPVYVLASVVSVAVNVSLRMHVCIGHMPGVERLAKQPHLHAHILLQEVRPVHDICIGLKTGSPLGLLCGDHLLVNQAPHLHCVVHVPHFGY